MRLVLVEPDIPQNAGTLMRTCACLGVGIDVVEPCGFVLDDRRLRRAVMDYGALLDLRRHVSWESFLSVRGAGRLVLLEPDGDVLHHVFPFAPDDRILVGAEGAGAPVRVRASVDAVVAVPMRPGARSLNVAVAAALVLGEALRQTGGFVMEDRGPRSGWRFTF
jgi:tRNA (cytidine/uridine-2'-O-)-methyltransferase